MAIVAALLPLSACTIVSIDEDQARRERQGGSFDAAAYVAKAWAGRISEQLQREMVDYAVVARGLSANVEAAGRAHGRQASDGSPWVFVVRGSAAVASVNRASRKGTVTLTPQEGGEPITLLTGPVVISSALRDALPSFNFNDYADQMAFAAANKALNDRALADTAAVLAQLKPGDQIRYRGVLSADQTGAARTMLAVSIERVGG